MDALTKTTLQTFVQKYYMGGIVTDSIWSFHEEQNELKVMFRTEGKSIIGTGSISNISDLPNFRIGINSAKSILTAISNLDDDMEIEMIKDDGFDMFTYMKFKDNDVTKKCKLSDPDMILNRYRDTKITDDIFDTVIVIDDDFIKKFNKIENTEDADNISMKVNVDGSIQFVVNYNENRIVDNSQFTFNTSEFKTEWDEYIRFDIDAFRRIFKYNKDIVMGVMKISDKAKLAKFEFKLKGNMTYTYYTPAFEVV